MSYGKANVDVIQSSTANVPVQFNDGNGTQVGTLCRAWVNFNGTGTVAIRASFNVSSITDNGTGDYTINFTNAMTDTSFSVVAMPGSGSAINNYAAAEKSDVRTSSSVRIQIWNGSSLYDIAYNSAAVFR